MQVTKSEARAMIDAFGAGSALARRSVVSVMMAMRSSDDVSYWIDEMLDVEERKGTYSIDMLTRAGDVYSAMVDRRRNVASAVAWY